MLMISISCAVSKPKRKASSLRASLTRSTTCSARFKVQFCCLIPNSGMTSKRRFVSTWTVSSMVDRASAAPIAFATAAFSGDLEPCLLLQQYVQAQIYQDLQYLPPHK